MTVVGRHGVFLVPLWLVLGGLTLAGSALYTAAVLGGRTAYPRWMAAASPAALLVALSVVAVVLPPELRTYLLPAGPNVVHVLFFALATACARAS